jgi:hypothetical protein
MPCADSQFQAWAEAEEAIDYPSKRGVRLVMGFPLWGQEYTRRFLDYSLPSLLASLDVLDAAGWEMIIYADEVAHTLLKQADTAGVYSLRAMPDDIVERLHNQPMLKYSALAAVHHVIVRYAGLVGAGAHAACPDAIYSERFFERLFGLAERHPAIVGMNLAMANAARFSLDEHRRGQVIAIPARTAGDLCLRGVNAEWRAAQMNDRPAHHMPASHVIWWRTRDTVRIHSPHVNIAWLSNEQCRQVEGGVTGTLDAEAERYTGDDWYAIQAEDDMAWFSVSGTLMPCGKSFVPFAAWRQLFWDKVERDLSALTFFSDPTRMPVEAHDAFPTETEVDLEFREIAVRT